MIMYVGPDDEVIICSNKAEIKAIHEFFTIGCRNIDDYTKISVKEFIHITPQLKIKID